MGTTEYTTLYHQHTVNNKYLYILYAMQHAIFLFCNFEQTALKYYHSSFINILEKSLL